jgi:plastocyanin
MSMRRCMTVLAIAILAALSTAPTAGAKTKIVVAGGPPPTANLAGSTKFPSELDLNGFFRRQITVNVGDSVRWAFSHRVVHTVTFLRPGQGRPTLETPAPAPP